MALLLIPELSFLLLIGTSMVFGVATLLLHGLLTRLLPFFAAAAFLPSLAALSLVVSAVAVLMLWRARWSRALSFVAHSDLLFLMALLPVLASTLVVTARNGYATGLQGVEFSARGFINGDTMTLFALTNAAAARGPGQRPLLENPFAGNGPLEYPTLLHEALASIMVSTGADITRAAWWLILPVLTGTVAVSVLSARVLLPGQYTPLWAGVVLLLAYGTSWESFTYAQSHTFLTGLFLLFLLLLARRDQSGVRGERSALQYAAGALVIILLFSNAVFGAAAVALAISANILQATNRRWPLSERMSGLIGAAILLLLFTFFPPGAASLGTPNVAYTAVPQFLTATVPALVVLWGLWDLYWLHRSASLLGAAVVLPALAFATLLLSGRDIVAENSPRFLFLLVLLGWPVVVPILQRVTDWWWRAVRHAEHTLAASAVLWGGAAFTVAVLLLPVFASVLGTLDVLLQKPPRVVSTDELAAFTWIRDNTPPAAVFLRAPESQFDDLDVVPLALPAFSGRAQLRSEYWLSPDDAVFDDVRSFFAGRGPLPLGAQYLFCGPEIEKCPVVGSVVFSSTTTSVQKP